MLRTVLAVAVLSAPAAQLAQCRKAIASAGALDPRARGLHVQAGCGPLYSDTACRGAWADVVGPLKLFPDRWAQLVKWCAQAYCRDLPEPVPDACDPQTAPDEAVWAELNRAVLKKEGVDPALVDALAPFFREASEGWPAPVLEVRSGTPAASATVFAADGGVVAGLSLSGVPGADELDALRRALGPRCRGALTVRAEKGLPPRIIKPVLAAAADAGCEYQQLTAR